MGFWDWFRGKPKTVEVADDVIWLTAEAKWAGLRRAIQEQLQSTPFVLVVAHFPATLARVKEELIRGDVGHTVHERQLSQADVLRLADLARGPYAALALAEALPADDFPNPPDDDREPLSIVAAERHFLPDHDERIVTCGKNLGRRCQLGFHLSLGDPLMEQFAGAWVGNLLQSLGLKESEPLASPMIARRVQYAQRSVAKRALTDLRAESAEQWLQLNVTGATPPEA